MAVYVAYEDVDDRVPERHASVSFVKLKDKIRGKPGRWAVATYKNVWTHEVVCAAIEDPTQIEADSLRWFKVSLNGKVREEK